MSVRTALVGLVASVALAVSGCSTLGGTGDLDYVAGNGNVVQVAVDDRESPISVSGTDLQGDPFDLAELRGQVVVVNVWWSGCGPCRNEMPMLVEAADETAGEATFVGINIRDASVERATSFERSLGVDYPSLYDPGSESLLRFGSLPPNSMPSTVVLDREGRVAAVISGEISSQLTLTELVEEIAAEDAESASDG